jgi:hypothetical protein
MLTGKLAAVSSFSIYDFYHYLMFGVHRKQNLKVMREKLLLTIKIISYTFLAYHVKLLFTDGN